MDVRFKLAHIVEFLFLRKDAKCAAETVPLLIYIIHTVCVCECVFSGYVQPKKLKATFNFNQSLSSLCRGSIVQKKAQGGSVNILKHESIH